jgi:hypothetical protein
VLSICLKWIILLSGRVSLLETAQVTQMAVVAAHFSAPPWLPKITVPHWGGIFHGLLKSNGNDEPSLGW